MTPTQAKILQSILEGLQIHHGYSTIYAYFLWTNNGVYGLDRILDKANIHLSDEDVLACIMSGK